MKLAACASYIIVTAYFSNEIQPVLKLWKKIAAANKLRFLLKLSMHYSSQDTW